MTKMTQGPWTRIRPLQIDDADAKAAAAIKTGELTRGGLLNNLVKVMAYCPRFVQLEVEYANPVMFDPVTFGYVKLIRPRPDGLMWLRSGMVRRC